MGFVLWRFGWMTDDSLLVGHEKAIQQTIDDLKKEGFDLTLDGSLDDYLSCEITFDKKKGVAWIHQPHSITKLSEKFGKYTKKFASVQDPGDPWFRNFKKPVDNCLC